MKDTRLFAKLSLEDIVALHASYHTNCLSTLYIVIPVLLYMQSKHLTDNCEMTNRAEGIALAELVSFIESERLEN